MNKSILTLLTLPLLSACDGGGQSMTSATQGAQQDQQQQAEAQQQALIAQAKAELVFVAGGEFLMGDFGRQYGKERLPYDFHKDSPLHTVELTSYSISQFKITNQAYQTYLTLTQRQAKKVEWFEEELDGLSKLPNTPARMDWYEAQAYCQWLGEVSGLPFALPTEAQWEYAARSRGQFLGFATQSGTVEIKSANRGVNVAGATDRTEFAEKHGLTSGFYTSLPGDTFPPNPLGVYDMTGNGYEWVHDWYDPNYYKVSPRKDPQGPDAPVHKNHKGAFTKVTRSVLNPVPFPYSTVTRTQDAPDTTLLPDKTARCVVNQTTPVQLKGGS